MKKLLALLLLATGLAHADTITSRAGLVVPTIGTTSWGTKLNNNFSIIDSSVAVLDSSNTFTNTNSFLGLTIRSGNSILFKDATNTKSVGILADSSNKNSIEISASDGIGINNTRMNGVDLAIFGGASSYGSFAVVGSSQDASFAYSGFAATGPISQSTLWTLPRADGASGQILTTDGSAHLGFSYLGNSQKNVQLNGSTGAPGTISSMTWTAASAPGMGFSIQPAFLTSGAATVIYSSAGINFSTPGSGVSFLNIMTATRGLTVATMTATGFDLSTTSTSVTGTGGLRVAFGVTAASMTFSADSSTQTTSARVGRIIKTQTYTTTTTSATTTTVYAQTNLTGSFTPLQTDSNIRVTVMGSLEDSNPSAGDCVTTVYRNPGTTNQDLSPSAGNGMCYIGDGGVAAQITVPCTMVAYDKPGSTSAQTYTVMFKISAGSATCTFTKHNMGSMLIEEISQ